MYNVSIKEKVGKIYEYLVVLLLNKIVGIF